MLLKLQFIRLFPRNYLKMLACNKHVFIIFSWISACLEHLSLTLSQILNHQFWTVRSNCNLTYRRIYKWFAKTVMKCLLYCSSNNDIFRNAIHILLHWYENLFDWKTGAGSDICPTALTIVANWGRGWIPFFTYVNNRNTEAII